MNAFVQSVSSESAGGAGMIDDPSTAGETRSLALIHPFLAGIVTAGFAVVAPWVLLVAAFASLVALGVAVVAIPVLYVLTMLLITRMTTGRPRVWWNITAAAVLSAFAVTISVDTQHLAGFGGVPALPISLGAAALLSSAVVLRGLARVVGIAAIVGQIVIVCVPFGAAQAQVGAQQATEDAADLARRNALTRPYVIPGLVVQIVLPSDYETVSMLSRDPCAPTREGYRPDRPHPGWLTHRDQRRHRRHRGTADATRRRHAHDGRRVLRLERVAPRTRQKRLTSRVCTGPMLCRPRP